MATRKLIVYPNKDLMIQAGAQRFVLALLDLLAERLPDGTHRTRVDVALSGGSAAQPLGLVLNDPLADAIDWSRVHFWWSDERFVPAYDTDRNALEARRLLLDQLVADGKLPESNIHEMAADTRSADDIADVMDQADSDDASVRAAADAANDALLDDVASDYERELVNELGPEPVIDLMILGMGPDGHYASLFPGHDEVKVTDRLTVGVNHSPKMPPLRFIDRAAHRAFTPYVVLRRRCRQSRIAGPCLRAAQQTGLPVLLRQRSGRVHLVLHRRNRHRVVSELSPL